LNSLKSIIYDPLVIGFQQAMTDSAKNYWSVEYTLLFTSDSNQGTAACVQEFSFGIYPAYLAALYFGALL
jgi:hypothetical protein